MNQTRDLSVLRCDACESRKIEIYDPITDCATIHCADCGAENGTFLELHAAVDSLLERRRQTLRKQLH
jgi:hypothetical protein